MDIIRHSKEEVLHELGHIPCGEIFIYRGSFYMRSNGNNNYLILVVNMETGNTLNLHPNVKVKFLQDSSLHVNY